MSRTAYLALGSNLGDRLQLLRQAVRALDGGGVRVVAASGVYETDAVADEAQPPYLNAVLRVETDLPAQALLERCLAVETALGRVRVPGRQGGSRTIDVDLLLAGEEIVAEADLVVPHPRLVGRAFVRIPLAEVAEGGLCHPLSGERLDVAAADPGVRLFVAELLP
jgi:2-amino-4-hydroxy-6-hydroxymethyldihydropteridine diphosphokinase